MFFSRSGIDYWSLGVDGCNHPALKNIKLTERICEYVAVIRPYISDDNYTNMRAFFHAVKALEQVFVMTIVK